MEHNEKTQILKEADKVDETSNDTPDKSTTSPLDSSSSLTSTTMNYLNSIIGSGIIGMPYAFRSAGPGLGILIIVFSALITDYSCVLMIKGGELSKSMSYQGMVQEAFGRPGFYILSLLQFVYPFLTMISYNVVVGDTVTYVVKRLLNVTQDDAYFVNRQLVAFLTSLLITLPLSLYRDIGKLAKTSVLSMLFIMFVLVTVYYRLQHWPFEEIPVSPDAWQFFRVSGSLKALSIMTFAFLCQHNSYLLYSNMRDASLKKWKGVTHVSVGLALVAVIVMALGGYATFNEAVDGDLLNNYCGHDDLMNVSRLFFSITILLTYPIECFVCREVIFNLMGKQQDEPMGQDESLLLHVLSTVILVSATFVLSLATDCLGIILELNGMIAAIPLAYIIPPLCYIRLEAGSLTSLAKIPAVLLASFGIIVTTVGTISIFTNGPDECQAVREMPYCFQNSTEVK